MEYEIVIAFHDDEHEIVESRLSVTQRHAWKDVYEWAAATTRFDDFTLRAESGKAIDSLSPLEWILQDKFGRPWRVAIAVRPHNKEDLRFSKRNVAATADVGLVHGVINAGLTLPVVVSETIENSIQHRANDIRVEIDRVNRRLLFKDDGCGVCGETAAVFGRAGASTSQRPKDEEESALSLKGSEERIRLKAQFGRYGIGGYSRLALGKHAVATIYSKTKDSDLLVVFREDMSAIEHQKTLVYDSETVHVSVATEHQKFFSDAPPESFTVVEIRNVDEEIFEEWERSRDQILQYCAEKYSLYAKGGSNVCEQLVRWKVLDGDDEARRRPIIVVDGHDLTHTGLFSSGEKDCVNKVADLLLLAEERDDAEKLRFVEYFSLSNCTRAVVVSLYWPSVRGNETRPEDSSLVFWNGLYLPEERLMPGWWSSKKPTNSRCSVLVFLESDSQFFAPELHKRHLRSSDPAYKLLAESVPCDLKREHVERCSAWSRTFDHEESFPISEEDSGRLFPLDDDCFAQQCKLLWMAGTQYTKGDYVTIDDEGGCGEVVALYKVIDADRSPLPGFAVLRNPLLPSTFQQEEIPPPSDSYPRKGRWCVDAVFTTLCSEIRGKVDASVAEKKALDAFPAVVKLLNSPQNTATIFSSPPVFQFGVMQRASRKKHVKDLRGLGFELEIKKPGEEWSSEERQETDCDTFTSTSPTLDAVGTWQFRGRLRSSLIDALGSDYAAFKKQRSKKNTCHHQLEVTPSTPIELVASIDGPITLNAPFSVAVEVLDSRGTPTDCRAFDLSKSRAWIDLYGEEEAVDLSEALLSTNGLTIENARLCSCLRDVFPVDGEFGLELWPVGEERVESFEVVTSAKKTLFVLGDASFSSLSELSQSGPTLAPRTIHPAECRVVEIPTKLDWANSSPPSLLVPDEWTRLRLRLLSAQNATVKLSAENNVECFVDDQDDASVEVRGNFFEEYDDSSFGIDLRLCAPYSWSGTVRLVVADCSLDFVAETTQKSLRVSIGNHESWRVVTEDELGPLSSDELGTLLLKVEIVDELEKVERAPFRHRVVLMGANDTPIATAPALVHGSATMSLSSCINPRDGSIVDVYFAALDEDDKPVGVFSNAPSRIRLQAGVATSLVVVDAPEFLAIGDAAPDIRVRVTDEYGVATNGEYETATLTISDEKCRLVDIPSPSTSDGVLRGGWRLRRAFSREDSDRSDFMATLCLSLGGLSTKFDVKLRPGSVHSVEPCQSVTVCHGAPFSPSWTLLDVDGNATLAHDGSFFALECDDNSFRVARIVEKRRKVSASSQSSIVSVEEEDVRAEVDGGRIEFESLVLRRTDSMLKEPVFVSLKPVPLVGCQPPTIREHRVGVEPSPDVVRLECDDRNELDVPTGRQVSDFVSFKGFDEAGREADLSNLRFRVNDGPQAWPLSALNSTSTKDWFLSSSSEDKAYVDVRQKGHSKTLARLWVRRVPSAVPVRFSCVEKGEGQLTVTLLDGDDSSALPISADDCETTIRVTPELLFEEDSSLISVSCDKDRCVGSTFDIVIRAEDATQNTRPLYKESVQVSVTLKQQDLEETIKLSMHVTNQLGKDSVTAETEELQRLKTERNRLANDIDQLNATIARRSAARAERDRERNMRSSKLDELREELAAAAGKERSATYSNGSDRERLTRLAARLESRVERGGYVGFLSHLGTVAGDDATAECVARLCGTNRLVLKGSRAVLQAREIVDEFNAQNPKPCHVDVVNVEQIATKSSPSAHTSARLAVDFVESKEIPVFQDILGHSLIYENDQDLSRAEAERDIGSSTTHFSRVSKESPCHVLKPRGRSRIGLASTPPPFTFGSPSNAPRIAQIEHEIDQLQADDQLEISPTPGDEERLLSERQGELDVVENRIRHLESSRVVRATQSPHRRRPLQEENYHTSPTNSDKRRRSS